MICPECLAECTDKRYIKRFIRRHIEGKICKRLKIEREEKAQFSKQLAQGTRSVATESGLIIEDGEFKRFTE